MNSLRSRLSLALALVLVGAGALLALGLQAFPRELVEGYVVSRLQHDAELLYARVQDAADPEQAADAAQDAAGTVYGLPLSGHYFRIVRNDHVIRSRSLWDEDLPPIPATGATSEVLRLPGPAGQQLLVHARRFASDGAPWLIAVAEDVSALDASIASFRRWLFGGGALALTLLLLLQRRLIARGLAPLDEAVEACRRLERGESVPVATAGPSEVRPMLDAVNRLAHHQLQRLARVRHAAGNLSHALKTPLAIVGQAADEADAHGDTALAATLRTQLDTMRMTIERELRRARLAGSGAMGEGFDARAQLDSLADALRRLHRERNIVIEVAAPERRFAVDREDMIELFGNLLDNACKWAHGRVRLTVDDGDGGPSDGLRFRIEDDGPGVPAALLGQLGSAGLRIDESRPGHGIGLAIVADIVAQYGGSIRYGRSDSLGGLCVDGLLP